MFDQNIISKFKKLKTPFYYYDLQMLEENLKILKRLSDHYGYQVHYALKANANGPVLKLISEFGFGADCVSGNEIKRALAYKFPPDKIVFAGVGKTDTEIQYAIQNDIQCINCESMVEMNIINTLANDEGKIARVALRINPDLEANTHRYITTGKKDNKFGINLSELQNVSQILEEYKNIQLVGLHAHIGSQIKDMQVFKNFSIRINEIVKQFEEQGINFAHLNLGGGLGIDYENPEIQQLPDYDNYFRMFHEYLRPSVDQKIHFELGRAVVAPCGALLTRVLYLKKGYESEFVIVETGMTELIRPALYNAYHKIINLTGNGPVKTYDVVGPVCESSDFLGKSMPLSEPRRGDLLAVLSTGAYAEVMASRYNLRDPAPAIYSTNL